MVSETNVEPKSRIVLPPDAKQTHFFSLLGILPSDALPVVVVVVVVLLIAHAQLESTCGLLEILMHCLAVLRESDVEVVLS